MYAISYPRYVITNNRINLAIIAPISFEIMPYNKLQIYILIIDQNIVKFYLNRNMTMIFLSNNLEIVLREITKRIDI